MAEKEQQQLMKRQFLELFIKYISSAAGSNSNIIIIFDRLGRFNEVVDRSVKEKRIGINVVQGTEVQ